MVQRDTDQTSCVQQKCHTGTGGVLRTPGLACMVSSDPETIHNRFDRILLLHFRPCGELCSLQKLPVGFQFCLRNFHGQFPVIAAPGFRECLRAHCLQNTAPDHDLLQLPAVLECLGSDRRNICPDRHILQFLTALERAGAGRDSFATLRRRSARFTWSSIPHLYSEATSVHT